MMSSYFTAPRLTAHTSTGLGLPNTHYDAAKAHATADSLPTPSRASGGAGPSRGPPARERPPLSPARTRAHAKHRNGRDTPPPRDDDRAWGLVAARAPGDELPPLLSRPGER